MYNRYVGFAEFLASLLQARHTGTVPYPVASPVRYRLLISTLNFYCLVRYYVDNLLVMLCEHSDPESRSGFLIIKNCSVPGKQLVEKIFLFRPLKDFQAPLEASSSARRKSNYLQF
jgi:hypothetical protein